MSLVFVYSTFYLYESATSVEISEVGFRPNIQNFVFKVVYTNQQADELAADGLEFRSSDGVDGDILDKGAIALCVFVERELAHITWTAFSEEAKYMISPYPYKVDFSNNEAVSGSTWTNPNYRRKGLSTYSIFKKHQLLKERGIETLRYCILTNNIASQSVYEKFNPTVYAKAHYLKILVCKMWREESTHKAIGRSSSSQLRDV